MASGVGSVGMQRPGGKHAATSGESPGKQATDRTVTLEADVACTPTESYEIWATERGVTSFLLLPRRSSMRKSAGGTISFSFPAKTVRACGMEPPAHICWPPSPAGSFPSSGSFSPAMRPRAQTRRHTRRPSSDCQIRFRRGWRFNSSRPRPARTSTCATLDLARVICGRIACLVHPGLGRSPAPRWPGSAASDMPPTDSRERRRRGVDGLPRDAQNAGRRVPTMSEGDIR